MTLKDNGDGTFGVIPTTWFQNDVWTCCRGCGQRVSGDSIHTCSPQLKPLSDEEIEQLAKRKANQILMDLLMPDVGEPKKIDWNIGCTNQHLVNFARAIEERHGIK